eukprot:TRINITY_DN3924_c0_g2_i1.p1 TRINITY_DN3924_c0_g2~~TRINITY_DN3924_c0_g2_i1.p1  ORF type:complete len:472 (+),score=88.22 TRINITY_DN3924_c0_g2_i1:71-1417(+)
MEHTRKVKNIKQIATMKIPDSDNVKGVKKWKNMGFAPAFQRKKSIPVNDHKSVNGNGSVRANIILKTTTERDRPSTTKNTIRSNRKRRATSDYIYENETKVPKFQDNTTPQSNNTPTSPKRPGSSKYESSIKKQRSSPKTFKYNSPNRSRINKPSPTSSVAKRKYRRRKPFSPFEKKSRKYREPEVITLGDSQEISYNGVEKDIILCQYPVNSLDAVTLTQSDIDRLENREYLNDNLVDFYIRYTLDKYSRDDVVELPSALYPFINDFNRIKKWTKKKNILNKDFIIMPACKNKHWRLFIICYPFCKEKGKILVFDSLNLTQKYQVKKPITSYLKKEYADKFDKKNTSERNVLSKLDVYIPEVPQQNNYYDCGIFVLKYIDLFLCNPPTNGNYRKHLERIMDFSANEIDQFRNDYKSLIMDIIDEYNNNLSLEPQGDSGSEEDSSSSE